VRQPAPRWHDFARTVSGAPAGAADHSITPTELSPALRAARVLWRALKVVLEACALFALLLLLFVRVPQVTGMSMEPQLRANEHVLISTIAYDFRVGWQDRALLDIRLHPIARGDVIAFEHAVGGSPRVYVKRVIGLPGDVVRISAGSVTIDGVAQRDALGVARDRTEMPAQRVPADAFFVLGDNRGESDDSRAFGAVPRGAVIGRANLVVWPLNRARKIR